MASWQIILILIGSVITGCIIGFLLYYVFKRFIKKPLVLVGKGKQTLPVQEYRQLKEPTLTRAVGRVKVTPGVEDRRHKKEPTSMVPLLSRRSITVLIIGCFLGIMGGLTYWAISPTLTEITESLQSANIGQKTDGPHTSTINTRVISQDNTYNNIQDLRRQGEYLAVKMSGPAFFEFLSQKLVEQTSWYSHSTEELSEMLTIRYDWDSESPELEITATGASSDEASFLASATAGAFNEYLLAEQENLRLEEYQNKTTQKEAVNAALIEAESKLANLSLQDGFDLNLSPTYAVLKAKQEALETELAIRASELATLVADGSAGHAYLDALDATKRTGDALSEVKAEMAALEAEFTLNYSEERMAYQNAEAEVESLKLQLDNLEERLAYLAIADFGTLLPVGFETVGEPSEPVPVIVERVRGRNAIMMGAVLGVCLGWVILNGRWLVHSMSMSSEAAPEDEKEDEA